MGVLVLGLLALGLGQGADGHRSCGAVGAPPPATAAEFTRLEEEWNQAYLRNDGNPLDALWSDRITLIFRGKEIARSQELGAILSKRATFKRYATTGLKIWADQGIVFVTGQLTRSGTVDGDAVDDVGLFKKVYERGPFGCWRVVLYVVRDAHE